MTDDLRSDLVAATVVAVVVAVAGLVVWAIVKGLLTGGRNKVGPEPVEPATIDDVHRELRRIRRDTPTPWRIAVGVFWGIVFAVLILAFVYFVGGAILNVLHAQR